MENIKLNEPILNIFKSNRKCIVNTDLDGLLSGMLLQTFLNWEIVGFSSCCGKADDDLWLKDINQDLKECVFIDLPVFRNDYTVIDQHFIAFDEDTVNEYNKNKNKVNPNILRNRLFRNKSGKSEYTFKYPFGTVHFILAILESLNLINDTFSFNFEKSLGNFDLADLILRADRVIGNTSVYTPNCLEWAEWIINIGGEKTKILFEKVKTEYNTRKRKEPLVESQLKTLGCIGIDGDCSNMLRNKDYKSMKRYFEYLKNATGLSEVPIFKVVDFNKLKGKKFKINEVPIEELKKETERENIFSFAFISTHILSITYLDMKED